MIGACIIVDETFSKAQKLENISTAVERIAHAILTKCSTDCHIIP